MWTSRLPVTASTHFSVVHNVFHVSQLKMCLRNPTKVVEIEGLQFEPELRMTYIEHPIKILDRNGMTYIEHPMKFLDPKSGLR